jgi:membrane fusion protein (multidrug efflux system)
VGQSPEGSYVYVVGADSKAERRPVKVGAWSGNDWVILEGLKEGEQVILEGLTKVRPGAPVSTAEPGAPAAPGAPGAPEPAGAPAAGEKAAAAGEERS